MILPNAIKSYSIKQIDEVVLQQKCAQWHSAKVIKPLFWIDLINDKWWFQMWMTFDQYVKRWMKNNIWAQLWPSL